MEEKSMKKLCSIILVLCMMLTLIAVPTVSVSAADRVTIGATDTEVTVYGVVYKVIRTADEFKAMTGEANYILANDIDLGGYKVTGDNSALITAWKGILDGNGYSVTNFAIDNGNNSGLFSFTDTAAEVTIQNITFGSAAAPIAGAPKGNGSNGVVAGKLKAKKLTLDNCVSYVNLEKADKAALSAFIGQIDVADCTVEFIDCVANGKLSGKNKIGAFVANVNQNNATITLKNCVNNVAINGYHQGVGGFVGHSPKDGVVITMTNCVNNGNITLTGIASGCAANVGGLIGQLNGNFTSVTIKNCENKGLLEIATAVEGATVNGGTLIGLTNMAGSVTVYVDDADYNTAGWIGKNESDPVKEITVVAPEGFKSVEIGANDAEVTVYGVVYKVIRTADQFKAMTGAENYILANDIDLGGHKLAATGGIITGWKGILDGNGYSVLNYDISGNDSGLFQVVDETAEIVIQNLTFGSEAAPITGTPAGNGSNGVVFGKFKGKSVTFINCDSYVKMEKTDKAAMSAFVGQPDLAGSSYTFEDCNAYGSISGRNKNGGFVGNVNQADVVISFKNCVNNVNIKSGNQGNGGFVGHSTKAGVVITFVDCVNNGKITVENMGEGHTPNIGGFVGQLNGEFASCTFKRCENKGLITIAQGVNSGTMIGLCSMKGDVVAQVLDVNISTSGWIGSKEDNTKDVKVELASKEDDNSIASADDLKGIKASGVYTVTADITLAEKVTLDIKDLEVTLALGGKTVTGEIEITGAGKLTVSGGTLAGTLTVGGGANVLLEKLSVNGTLASTDASAETTLTVKSGEFSATAGNAINWGGKGTLTVDGGSFTAAGDFAALAQTNGTVVINNGIFKGKDALKADATATATTSITLNVFNGTFEGTRSALYYTGSNGESFAISVAGGSFKGTSDGALFTDTSDAKVAIEAGTFDEEIPAECCKQYYVSYKNEETGLWQIKIHDCDYEGVAWESINTGSHKKACKICGEVKTAPHDFVKNVDNGNGTHSKVCGDCDYKSQNGIKHTTTVEDCGDGKHKTTCKDCDLNEVVDHTWGDAKSLEEGKHEKTCTACDAKTTEDCVATDGKCADCGAELEKSGCGSAVAGGLFALVTILALPALLVRKKKED